MGSYFQVGNHQCWSPNKPLGQDRDPSRLGRAGFEPHGHRWQAPALGSVDADGPRLVGAQGMLPNDPQHRESSSTPCLMFPLPFASPLPGTARRHHPTHPGPPPPSTPGAFTHGAPAMCQRTSYEAVFFNLHTKKPPRDSPVRGHAAPHPPWILFQKKL